MQLALARSRVALNLSIASCRASRYLVSAPTGSAGDAAAKARERAIARRVRREDESRPSELPPSLSLARPTPKVPADSPGSLVDSAGAGTPDASESVTQPAVSSAGRELVLSPPALVVTREYEWGNIVFGFEQANRWVSAYKKMWCGVIFMHCESCQPR